MHRTDLFIVSGADLEYTKKYQLMVDDAVLEYLYLKEQKSKTGYKIKNDSKKVS